MNQAKSIRVCVFTLALAILILALLACSSPTEQLREAAEQPTATTRPAEPTSVPTDEVEPTSTPEPTSTATLQPTATPTFKLEDIHIVGQGFGQDKQNLGFAFLVENPNAGLAFESSRYQVAAYDDTGSVVKTNSGYISLILPSQKVGFGGTMFLDEGVTVSELEVQLKQGDSVETEPIPDFKVDSTTYYESDYFEGATAVVSSPFNRDLKDLRVSAVAYNDAGEIVGGGFTFLNFILANDSTGVEVSFTSSGDVSSVELYPSVSGLTLLDRGDELPEGADDIALVKQGFGQSDRDVGFGMLIENPNDDFSIENSQYHVTAFAEDGHVLATDSGYVSVLLPEQVLGVGGGLWLGEGMVVDHTEIQVKAGKFVESEPIPYFTAENVSYQADTYSSKVTGQIVSPYETDITDLRVSGIAYNQAEEIIGGGFTFLDFVPAGGKAAAEVSVTVAEDPAETELYATVSGLSEFE